MTTRNPSDGLPDAGAFARPVVITEAVPTPIEPVKIATTAKDTHVDEYLEAMHYMQEMMEGERAATRQVLGQDVTAPHIFSYGSVFTGPEVVSTPPVNAISERENQLYAQMERMMTNGMNKVIAEVQQKMEDVQKENVELKELFHELTAKNEELSEVNDYLLAQQNQLAEENERLQKQLSEGDGGELQALREDLHALNNLHSELVEHNNETQQELVEMKNANEDLQKRHQELVQYGKELEDRNHELQSHLDAMSEDDDNDDNIDRPEPVETTKSTNSSGETVANGFNGTPPTKKPFWSIFTGRATRVVVATAAIVGALWGGFVGKKGADTASQLLMPSATASTPAPTATPTPEPHSTGSTTGAPNAPMIPQVIEESAKSTPTPTTTPEPRLAGPTKSEGTANLAPIPRGQSKVSTSALTATPKPVGTSSPTTSNLTLTSESSTVPKPIVTPESTVTPEPVGTSLPVASDLSVTSEPSMTPEPTATPEATLTPAPVAAPEPSTTPEPTPTPEPCITPEPTATPVRTEVVHPSSTADVAIQKPFSIQPAQPLITQKATEWNTPQMGEVWGIFAQISPQITVANNAPVFTALEQKYVSAEVFHDALTTITIQKNHGVSQALKAHLATVFEGVLDDKEQEALYTLIAEKNFRNMVKVVRDKAGVEVYRTPVQVWSMPTEYPENPHIVDRVEAGDVWDLGLNTLQLTPVKK